MLSERQELILRLVVDAYLASAKPVPSKEVAERPEVAWGASTVRSELALQRRFRELGLTTRSQYLRNVAVRGGYRLIPESVRKVAYRRLLANRSGGTHG